MAKQFAGFTPQQTATLLQKMGYTGPADSKAMGQFLAANPAAAARLGKYTDTAQRMIAGMPAAKTMPPAAAMGMQEGGLATTTPTIPVAPTPIAAMPEPQKIITDIKISRPDIVSAATNILKSGETPSSYTLRKNATGGFDMVFNTGTVVPTGFKKQADADWNANAIIRAASEYSTKQQEQDAFQQLQAQYQQDLSSYQQYQQQAAATTQADPEALNRLRTELSTAQIQRNNYLREIQTLPDNDPRRTTLSNLIQEAEKNISTIQQQVRTIGGAEIRGAQQALVTKAYADPTSLVTQAAPATISEAAKAAGEIPTGTAQLGTAPTVAPTGVTAAEATTPQQAQAVTFESIKAAPSVEGALGGPAVGAVSAGAQVAAQTMKPTDLSSLSLNAAQIEKARQVEAVPDMTVSNDQLVTAAKATSIPSADAAISSYQSALEAVKGVVKPEELVDPAGILNGAKAVEAIAATMDGLSQASTALAVQGEFTPEALAVAAQGTIPAVATVQGQLAALMASFNDGTPAWAAGAMRQANAAMAARGLGGSSMAGAAIVQAAMESALPIAAADAEAFRQMEMTNLNNRQQVAIANAAAQQNIQLMNLSNKQQVALQNSANSFALQSQNLSNQQQVVLANAQFKAALQEQTLSINTQTALANAARYAEVSNINLNNAQQTALQRSAENLQVEMANLSNRQQTALTNAQIEAAIRGQELSNEQQARVVNAARIAEIANMNFTAKQQRAVENARLAQTVDIANLDAKNAKVLADAAAMSQLDLTNLSNKQQAAVQNAQAFLQMDMQNLNNQQQTLLFNSQSRVQALLTDAASENAAKQFNASSQMQVDQFNTGLASQISQFNAAQKNALEQFNAGEANAAAKFNAEVKNARDVFEAQNALVIAQSNAQWRQNIATVEAANQQQANMQDAMAATAMTKASLDNLWQRERDLMQYAFTASENAETRATELLVAKMDNEAKEALQRSSDKMDLVKEIFSNIDW